MRSFRKVSALALSAAMAMSALTMTAAADEAKTYKVGIIQFMDHASLNQIQDNLEKRLDEIGEEKGVTFDYADYAKNGEGDASTLNQIATELREDQVDLIVAIATPAAQVAQAVLEDSDIPLVFSAVSDPVGAGLAKDMEKPGMNITGTSDALNTNTMLDMMLALNPDTDYVGLLYSKSEANSEQPIADAKAYLDEKGIKYIEKTGTNTDEVSSAADVLVAEGVDAVFTPTDNTVMNAELAIFEKFTEAGIPHYAGADSFALNGGFCGFGVNYADLGVQTADMVATILVDGQAAAETPVATFDNGIATINTETAEAIGLNMDDVKAAFEPFCSAMDETATAEEFE